jgi:hypothetical protein
MIFPWQITCGKGPGKLTNETMETSRFKKLKISSHPLPPGFRKLGKSHEPVVLAIRDAYPG